MTLMIGEERWPAMGPLANREASRLVTPCISPQMKNGSFAFRLAVIHYDDRCR